MIKWMISSSCLILMITLIRKLFQGKISFRLQYALWLLAAVRLLVPVNLGSSMLSIENFANRLQGHGQQVTMDIGLEQQENTAADFEKIKVFESIQNIAENEQSQVETLDILQNEELAFSKADLKIEPAQILYVVWLTGAGITAVIFTISNLVFGKRVKHTRKRLETQIEKIPVYESSKVETPCLFGMFRPAIYVTSAVTEDECILRHAVVHELTHYEQGDTFWSVLRCICLILHWYNPFVWWAAKLSKQDAELACDETTIKKLGEEERLSYGKTLIRLTCEKRQDLFIAATTMISDKKSITERIQRIAKRSKRTIYALAGVLLMSVLAVGCTFTGAKDESSEAAPMQGVSNENPQESGENLSSPGISESISDNISNVSNVIEKVNRNLREGYVDAKLTYVDNAEVGWNYYSDNPWSTEEERDALAQAALKELYTLTGYQVTECTYTTDGRSKFVFGKSDVYIKKCIAFYTRDFGYALCGDSVPYQGFMNARKVHYSDVQQISSPLTEGYEEYEGGLSKWYLEHSGVYQGEKIIAYEETQLDDNVYIHVKLLFDGGYYIVSIDKSISSCHAVKGPYYDAAEVSEIEIEETETAYNKEPQKDKVCLAVMPDGISKAGGDYRYIVPEDQIKWLEQYKQMRSLAKKGAWKEGERSVGIWLVYNDEWTCLTDQGFIFNFEKRTEKMDAPEFYELCFKEVKSQGISEPVKPEEIKNLTSATLDYDENLFRIDDPSALLELQKAFNSSEEIRGGSACPFTALLTLKDKDGEEKTIYLATDTCNAWLSSGVYYQYFGFEDIEELRSFFDKRSCYGHR